jgi:uncharacterized protein YegP (UPF0339 family)
MSGGMFFEIVMTPSGQYVARIKDANGEIIFVTETHPYKSSAIHAAKIVRTHSGTAPIHDRLTGQTL